MVSGILVSFVEDEPFRVDVFRTFRIAVGMKTRRYCVVYELWLWIYVSLLVEPAFQV